MPFQAPTPAITVLGGVRLLDFPILPRPSSSLAERLKLGGSPPFRGSSSEEYRPPKRILLPGATPGSRGRDEAAARIAVI
jgi:hypothetical protein